MIKPLMLFKTRAARDGDVEILYDLIAELAQYEESTGSPQSLTKENLFRFGFGENPYFFAELAEVDGKIVGYALYYYTFSASLGFPILYLEDLYVKPEFRRMGIGKTLMKQLSFYAKQRDCCRLEWHVFKWNDSAIKFYENLGSVLKRDLVLVHLAREASNELCPERIKEQITH